MGKRRPLEGDAYWLEANPLAMLKDYDPLRETTAQARAERRGESFIPFEERVPTPSPLPQPSPAPPLDALDVLQRANANRDLSPMGLKILLAVLTHEGTAAISLSHFSERTGLSKNGVISGIRNALDQGMITRQQFCPRCDARLPFSEDQKTMPCAGCGREVPPQARYAVFMENSPVPVEDRAVRGKDSPVTQKDSPPVRAEDSPVPVKDSPPVLHKNRGAVRAEDSPVRGKDSLSERAAALASRMAVGTVRGEDSPVLVKNSPPVLPANSLRARTDSDSRIIESKNLDSRIPATPGSGEAGRVVYASGEWQQITEKLAKDSARRIGDKSVGFHIKVWAHARKVDWEQGGRRFEDGLSAIAGELEGKHNSMGKGQGAMWTKMVRKYFEEKGFPMLTEAETAEWKELHGSYAPP